MVRRKSILEPGSAPDAKFTTGNHSNENSINIIRQRITYSSLYIQAYELFSQDPDPIWLQRLTGIVSSVTVRNPGLFESIEGRKYQSEVAQVEEQALNDIENLLSEYQQFKNSLPVTQTQQLAVAGINSAITGSGIQSSSIGANPVSDAVANPGNIQSGAETFASVGSGVLSLFSSGVNLFSAVVSGYKQLKDLGNSTRQVDELIRQGMFNRDLDLRKFGLSKDYYDHSVKSALELVRHSLTSEGFINVPSFSDWNSFSTWWDNFGTNESNSFNIGNRSKKQLFSQAEQVYYDALHRSFTSLNDEGQTVVSDSFSKIVDDMVKYNIDTWKLDFRYNYAKKRYDYLYQMQLDPARLAENYQDRSDYDADLAKYSSEIHSYEAKREELKISRILGWIRQSANDPQARALVAKALENIDPAQLAYIDNYEAREILDFLNTGNLNPAPASVNVLGSGVSQKR